MYPLLLLLLCPMAEAWPRRRAPTPPEPPPVQVPDGRAPLDPATVPSLKGQGATLEGGAVHRGTTRYHFALDTVPLGALGPEDARRLQRHLAADPRWRVEAVDGVVVASLRQEGRAARGGYHLASDTCFRVSLRFGGLAAGSEWASSGRVARYDAGAETLSPTAFTSDSGPCADQPATAFVLTGPNLSLDAFESGDTDRRRTTEALEEVLSLVAEIPLTGGAVDARGFDPLAMPKGEPRRVQGPPEVEVRAGAVDRLEVRGWLNPGAAGWTWLRLLTDGAPWAEPEVASGSRERVGWSADAEERFLFQGVLPVPGEVPAGAVAEVWFQPDDGGEPVRLVQVRP